MGERVIGERGKAHAIDVRFDTTSLLTLVEMQSITHLKYAMSLPALPNSLFTRIRWHNAL
jgi:hypothetical protein